MHTKPKTNTESPHAMRSTLNNRAGEGISEPLSDILYNMLSDELFKHPGTQIESLVLSCR